MGQKVNPKCFRISPNLYKGWSSVLYAKKGDYSKKLLEDIKIRNILKKDYSAAQISDVVILRTSSNITLNIFVKKPGIIIGKSGADIEKLKKALQHFLSEEIFINIKEVKKIFLDAELVAQNICTQIENRISFKKAMKTSMQNSMKQGSLGIRVLCAGRLGGAEIARAEWYKEGSIPLHSLRVDIDYASCQALTTYGLIGVKVWINRGNFTKI
ncbi:MAG: 30S ribosomal protein S3 [Rickettsia sp.]|nr:30S ribosomal protein S3 [Rickettsia sp.]